MASQQQSSKTPVNLRDQWSDLYERVHDIFYCQGRSLYWKKDISTWLKKGRIAGYVTHKGYRKVQFDGCSYPVHRIVFLYHRGYMPEMIDHIDGDRLNNSINNLRECDKFQNGHNRKINKNSSSGVKGVSWHKHSGTWRARIQVKGRRIELGGFYDIEDAKKCIEDARECLHKDFAKHG